MNSEKEKGLSAQVGSECGRVAVKVDPMAKSDDSNATFQRMRIYISESLTESVFENMDERQRQQIIECLDWARNALVYVQDAVPTLTFYSTIPQTLFQKLQTFIEPQFLVDSMNVTDKIELYAHNKVDSNDINELLQKTKNHKLLHTSLDTLVVESLSYKNFKKYGVYNDEHVYDRVRADLDISLFYRRDNTHTCEQQQQLILSILEGLPLGVFYKNIADVYHVNLKGVDIKRAKIDNILYDGVWRLSTIVSFMRNEFSIPLGGDDILFRDIEKTFIRALRRVVVPLYVTNFNTMEDVLEMHRLLNFNQRMKIATQI